MTNFKVEHIKAKHSIVKKKKRGKAKQSKAQLGPKTISLF